MSPPASLSGSNASFASNKDEAKYLHRAKVLHWVRIALVGFIMAIALVVIGCVGHTLHFYHQTLKYEEWWLFLWPDQLELRPTVAFIACGAIILVSAMVYIVAALLPSPRSRTTLLNCLATASGLIGIVSGIVATAISVIVTDPHESNGIIYGHTIQTWTCTWATGVTDFKFGDRDTSPETIDGVDNFKRLCDETNAATGFMSLLVATEFVLCIFAGLGWWLELKMAKKRAAGVGGWHGSRDSLSEQKVVAP